MSTMQNTDSSKKWLRVLALWAGAILLLGLLPFLLGSNFMISMASEMGIMIIFALSYNMLLGQGGMLSFGHAVYFGLGGFIAMHALNFITEGVLCLPLELMPLIGSLGGLFGRGM